MHKDLRKEIRRVKWKKHKNGGSHEIWGPADVPISIPLPSGTKLTTFAVSNAISSIKRTERRAQQIRDAGTEEEVTALMSHVDIDPETPYPASELADILGIRPNYLRTIELRLTKYSGYRIFKRKMTPILAGVRVWPRRTQFVYHALPSNEYDSWVAKFAAVDAASEAVAEAIAAAEEAEVIAEGIAEAGLPEPTYEELRLEVGLYEEQLERCTEQLDELWESLRASHAKEESLETQLKEMTRLRDLHRDDAEAANYRCEKHRQAASTHEQEARKAREKVTELTRAANKAVKKGKPSSLLQTVQEKVIAKALRLREGMKYDEEKQLAYITTSSWVEFQNSLIEYYRYGGK